MKELAKFCSLALTPEACDTNNILADAICGCVDKTEALSLLQTLSALGKTNIARWRCVYFYDNSMQYLNLPDVFLLYTGSSAVLGPPELTKLVPDPARIINYPLDVYIRCQEPQE